MTPCLKKDGTPLSVYSTEAEAKESARYQKEVHGIDLFPYLCDRCGKWHLTSVNGKPNKCHCTNSNGKSKYLYPTQEAAEQQLEWERSRGYNNLRIYPCPCPAVKGWHLTHTNSW